MKTKSENASLIVLVSISTLVILFIAGLFLTGFVYDPNPKKDPDQQEGDNTDNKDENVVLYLDF